MTTDNMASNRSVHFIDYRPEIDGLRALAVSLVMIVHAFPKRLPNGFIGVGIFLLFLAS
jgi:peptidoglycan/LPS O-acetylase OafA/YrhL